MPTRQETFDTVARHLLTQGRRATVVGRDGKPECVYRSPDGLKCAAGCLIPDYKYTHDMEGNKVTHSLVAAAIPEHDEDLVCDLQDVHDWWDVVSWPRALASVATKLRLNTAVLDEFPNWKPKDDGGQVQSSEG